MKHFRCGDVVPGCSATFAGTEEQIFAEVAVHAREVHGLPAVPDRLADRVRGAMVDA